MKNKRINSVSPENAQEEVKNLYQTIQQKMKTVPNIFKNMGNSAAVLKGYFALNEAVGETSLSPLLREKIALAVGQANSCNYCLSVHTVIGHTAGINDNDILEARKGASTDSKENAILSFVKKVVDKKGKTTDEDVAQLKAAGVSDKEVVEIVLVISLNMFTNYFNHITDTELDFPQAPNLN